MENSLNDLVDGFNQAYARTRVAKNERDYREVFFSLFETLNWIVAIDFRLQRDRKNERWYTQFGSEGNVIRALRFARNRIQHQWADIVYNATGVTLPIEIPAALHEWRWKELQSLPPVSRRFQDSGGEILYQQLLEEKPVRYSLQAVAEIFAKI